MRSFDKLANFRDLGGLRARDGVIQPKRLLRSGQLYQVPEAELDILVADYNLKTLVDFRTDHERLESPNPAIDKVHQVHIDLVRKLKRNSSKDNLLSMMDREDVDKMMEQVYTDMVMDVDAQQGFKSFLRLLNQQQEGAVLWHCFAGKDRTGLAAAYILSALDVDEATIMDDYLKTNALREKENGEILAQAKEAGATDKELANIQIMMSVKARYLEHAMSLIRKEHGSMLHYLDTVLDFDQEQREVLKSHYLQ